MPTSALISALVLMSMAFAAQSAWLNKRLSSAPFFDWLNRSGTSRILQLIYFIGLPYLALLSGLIPARLFGLKAWDSISRLIVTLITRQLTSDWKTQLGIITQAWSADASASIGIIASLIGVSLFFGWLYLRGSSPKRVTIPSHSQWIVDIIHWSFYRAAIWRISGDLYLSVLGGIFLVLIEYLLVYKLGTKKDASETQLTIRFVGNTVVSVAFLFAPNLWVVGLFFLIGVQFLKVSMTVYEAQS